MPQYRSSRGGSGGDESKNKSSSKNQTRRKSNLDEDHFTYSSGESSSSVSSVSATTGALSSKKSHHRGSSRNNHGTVLPRRKYGSSAFRVNLRPSRHRARSNRDSTSVADYYHGQESAWSKTLRRILCFLMTTAIIGTAIHIWEPSYYDILLFGGDRGEGSESAVSYLYQIYDKLSTEDLVAQGEMSSRADEDILTPKPPTQTQVPEPSTTPNTIRGSTVLQLKSLTSLEQATDFDDQENQQEQQTNRGDTTTDAGEQHRDDFYENIYKNTKPYNHPELKKQPQHHTEEQPSVANVSAADSLLSSNETLSSGPVEGSNVTTVSTILPETSLAPGNNTNSTTTDSSIIPETPPPMSTNNATM